MNIKITPLILFLFLLLVLVVSILFSRYLPAKEGFISFANEKSHLASVYIPQYSSASSAAVSSVVKLYDNSFFDMRNANLIEVDGTAIISSTVSGNISGNVIETMVGEGSASSTGAVGTGSTGAVGTGSAGAVGTGTAGAVGSAGTAGTAGAVGTGSAGTAGAVGSAGTAGAVGTGSAGTAGAVGTGSAGAAGTGSAGSTGVVVSTSPVQSSISKIYVLKREELALPIEYSTVLSTNGTPVPVDVPESQIPTTSNVYLTKIYNTRGTNTDKYQILYMTWGTRTYLHIIRLGDSPKHISSYLMGEDSAGHVKVYSSESNISVGPYVDDADSNNGKYLPVQLYDSSANIYQLSKSVRYDQRNGNLIIFNKAQNSIKVYNRSGAETTTYRTTMPLSVPISTFEPWMVNDADRNMVLYMPHQKKTFLVVIQMDPSDSSKFILGKIARFNESGTIDDTAQPPAATAIPTIPTDDSPMSEYNKWLAYWSIHVLYENQNDDDYIRKTQIVPPVCPSCPSCPSCSSSGGICTNCGGNGGCGTLSKDGKSIVKEENGKKKDSNGNVIERTVESTGNVLEKTVSTTGDVLKSTGSEVSSLLKGTASGTTDLLKSTATGTTDLLKSTATGTTDLLKSAGSGTVDLLKSAGTGTVDLLRSTGSGLASLNRNTNTQRVGQQQIQQGGLRRSGETQRAAPVSLYRGQPLGQSDYYSQYGALQPKGDDFIPITADFSAFRK